jgi:hypothetical protein
VGDGIGEGIGQVVDDLKFARGFVEPKNRSWRAKAVQYRGFFAVDVG